MSCNYLTSPVFQSKQSREQESNSQLAELRVGAISIGSELIRSDGETSLTSSYSDQWVAGGGVLEETRLLSSN